MFKPKEGKSRGEKRKGSEIDDWGDPTGGIS